MWLAATSLMRPSIPDWLEDHCQRLNDNDPTLTTLELSHQRIDDASTKYLCEALRGNTTVSILIISFFNIVDDGAFALGQIIGSNKCIKKLQFRDLYHPREVSTLFDAIGRNDTIQEVSLRHCRLCWQSADALGFLIRHHRSMEEFRLVDTLLGENSIIPLTDALKENRILKRLFIVNCDLGPVEANILALKVSENTALHELQLCENNLGDDGVLNLCRGLAINTSLVTLNLRSNNIGHKGALAIETLIERQKTMRVLNIASNQLGDSGAASIAEGLRKNSIVTSLDISGNSIGFLGAKSLAYALKTNQTLKELNLSFNSIGDDGTRELSNVLEFSQSLRSLSMRRNRITNTGASYFAHKLPSMRSLKELILTKNMINSEGGSLLLEGLRTNMELEYLHIEDSDLSQPVLKQLSHWIRLNQAGRRIFRDTNLYLGLWAHVLAKVNDEAEVLFHFLNEKPEFLQNRKLKSDSS